MSKWLVVCGLVFLNVVLGVGVYQHLFEQPAMAQAIGAGAKPDIVAVAGSSSGQTAVYLLDVTTGKLIALRLDVTNKQMNPVAQANVADALNRAR